MSSSNIKYREYKGITVGDLNDTIRYIKESGLSGDYVISVSKTGSVITALNSSGEQVSWTTGGGSGSGYEPDFATIELTEDDELTVVDYISATSAQQMIDDLEDSLKVWAEDTFCLESFAVELDERLESVEEELTEISPIVSRSLLIPVSTILNTELVGIGSDKEQKRVKIGSGLGYDSTTDTLYATGGGGGTPTFNITADLDYQEETITVTSPSYKNEIESFKQTYGYYPIVKLSLRVLVSGSVVQTGDYQANDIQEINNQLNIWFAKSELDQDTKLEISQVKFVDTGSTMSATFSNMKTESFASDKYYDKQALDARLSALQPQFDIRIANPLPQEVVLALNYLSLNKQNKTDDNLTTTSKNVVGAINEVNTKVLQEKYTHISSATIYTGDTSDIDIKVNIITENTISTPYEYIEDVYDNFTNIKSIVAYKDSDKTPLILTNFNGSQIEFLDIQGNTIIWKEIGSFASYFTDAITTNWG